MNVRNFDAIWREDGTATVVGRLTSRSGSGAATGNNGEGNWAQQADLSSITYAVHDVTDEENISSVTSGTVTISSSVFDTPRTASSSPTMAALWSLDQHGYNFIHDIPPAAFPTAGQTYRVEYKFTFANGAIGWAVFEGQAEGVHTS